MSERSGSSEGLDLESALVDLGPRVEYPSTPDLAAAVAVAIGRAALPAPSRARTGPLAQRRWRWAFAAVALLAVVGCVALFPGARSTVADRFGVDGVRIFFLDAESTLPPSPVGADLRLGRRLRLDEARAAVPFTLHVPSRDGFEEPDEVYVSSVADDGMVSFVYRPRPELPATSQTGVGALLTQFRGETEEPLATKGVGPTASVDPVAVGDGQGFWIEGEAHVFLYRDANGDVRDEAYRLAGNVLLWEQDGLTFRLESALGKDEALAIAATLRESR